MEYTIYTKTDCPFCVKAKEWFDNASIGYEVVNLDDDLERFDFYEKHNVKSVPQIFIGNKLFGDYSKLVMSPDEILRSANYGGLQKFSTVYKPFLYPWAVTLTQEHEDGHWTENEADLQDDVSDWKGGKMLPVEKSHTTNILKFFTASDIAVGQNYCDQLIPKFKNNEIRNMLVSFCCREGVHQRAYALLNDTLGLPESEYSAFMQYSELAEKFDYMMSYDNSTQSGLGLCLAKSVFNEGVSLFASFAMLLNYQRFGKMKGMGKIVEWSIRDEALIEGTLVVTKDGNIPIEDITLGDEVLQFDMGTQEFSYITPHKHQGVIRDESYEFSHPEFNQHVSPNHRMIYEQNGVIKECLAKDFVPADDKYFLVVLEDAYKKIKSTDVKIQHHTHEPKNFYCIGVEGKSFVVQDELGNRHVTGNTMHCQGIARLFRQYCKEHPRIVTDKFKKAIYDIARKIVELEDLFIDLSYEMGEIEGLSKKEVKQYIRHIADRRLLQLGMKPIFGVKDNPLTWLDYVLNGVDHTNFFEGRVTEYAVGNTTGKWSDAYDFMVD